MTDSGQSTDVDRPRVEAFIARWQRSEAAERANYALFLVELCDILGLPHPDPTTGVGRLRLRAGRRLPGEEWAARASVIPAKAGIHHPAARCRKMDPGFRRDDEKRKPAIYFTDRGVRPRAESLSRGTGEG